MQFVAVCPDGQPLMFYQSGLSPCCYAKCTDGSVPSVVPVTMGLADLAWSDVSLMIGALMLSCSIAIGFNIVSKQFYRG